MQRIEHEARCVAPSDPAAGLIMDLRDVVYELRALRTPVALSDTDIDKVGRIAARRIELQVKDVADAWMWLRLELLAAGGIGLFAAGVLVGRWLL